MGGDEVQGDTSGGVRYRYGDRFRWGLDDEFPPTFPRTTNHGPRPTVVQVTGDQAQCECPGGISRRAGRLDSETNDLSGAIRHAIG